MRFSLSKKFMYLANMKTGSTSIRKVLTPLSNHDLLEKNGLYAHHWGAAKYKKIFEQQGWEWNDFYSFTTIRNPWARIVSFYKYGQPDALGNHKNDKAYDESSMGKLSFSDWLRIRYNEGDSVRLLPDIKRFISEKGVSIVSEIYKIEDLNGDKFIELLEKCNISSDVSVSVLPKLNQTTSDDYRAFYKPNDIDIVSKVLATDIEVGNYTFGD